MNNSAQWASYHNLQPGDVIKSPKSLANMIQHYSLFWGYDGHGQAWVIENVVGHGVIYNRMDHFMSRVGTINSIQPFRGTEWARQQVIKRAAQRVGWKYDALSYNCEHFVNDTRNFVKASKQANTVKGVLAGLTVVCVIAALARRA
ncbi:MAG: lecithin retinol acyltransferase family protein [Flavobacteriales bacterium]|nr:lecithin retinol acyltransferase family protein [Flavobacteriales bacterium]